MPIVKKLLKILFFILAIILIAIFEVSFLKTLGHPFSYLQIILTIAIFTAIFSNLGNAMWWIILGGYILDIYSPFVFGAAILSLFFAVITVKNLAHWKIAAHNVYSLSFLSILGTFIYNFSFFVLSNAIKIFDKSKIVYGLSAGQIFYSILANLILTIIFFIVAKQISKRFKTTYL